MTKAVLGSLCLLGLVPVGGRAQELGRDVAAEVARFAPEGVPRELTACKLQDALWGRYDVRVHVTIGTDGLPYLFSMTGGRFSRIVDPDPVPGPTRFERTGHITALNPAEAFGRGLPFFIEPAEDSRAGSVAIRVMSNPRMATQTATLLVLIDQPGAEGLVSLALPIEPAQDVQRLVVAHPALNGPVLVRAAVIREAGTMALMLGCVLSNELEFRPPL